MNKKNIVRIIDIFYWGLIIITTIIRLIEEVKTGSLNVDGADFSQYEIKHYIMIFCVIFFVVLVKFFSAILQYIQITLVYIGVRLAFNKFYKEKLDKIDLKKYNSYYREIIEQYSPGILSYIDNFSIDKNTFIATLMSLELKGIIDSNLKVIKNDFSELDENEKYICENLNNIDFMKFENLIIEDCKKYNLLKNKEIELNKIKKKRMMAIVITLLSFILNVIIGSKSDPTWATILVIASIIGIVSLIVMVYYTVAYIAINTINPYIRSKKAEKINEKLEGLKNYLKDFSTLEDKDNNQLAIWEDYLIYSVIFNQNKKIIKEFEDKIEAMDN